MSRINSLFNSFQKIYDIVGGCIGKPSASQFVLHFVSPRVLTLPANLPNSYARCNTTATSSTTFTIYKNDTEIGTIVFDAGSNNGTIAFASDVELLIGDFVYVQAPSSQDATLADLTITLKGQLSHKLTLTSFVYYTAGYALFGAGVIVGSASSTTEKYMFLTDARTSGTSLTTSRYIVGSAGNKEKGYFAGGHASGDSAVVDKYTYSSDAVSAITSLSVARNGTEGTSNSTIAYFAGGISEDNTNVSNVADKYTFSTDARSALTSLTTARQRHVSFSNNQYGYYTSGKSTKLGNADLSSTERYQFSNDTKTSSTATDTRAEACAGSNTSFALIGGGLNSSGSSLTSTLKFAFANETAFAGATLTYNPNQGGSACNGRYTLFGGGGGGVSTTAKYSMTDDTCAAGSNLNATRDYTTATASNPGHI